MSTFWCLHFKKDAEELKRIEEITTVITQVMENVPNKEPLKYFVQKKIGEMIQSKKDYKYLCRENIFG